MSLGFDITDISAAVVPTLLALCGLMIFIENKRDIFSEFLKGAKAGLVSCFNLLPALAALCVGTEMLKASGFTEWLAELMSRPLMRLGIPSDLSAFLIIRPFSGSASIALLNSVITDCGPDSYQAYLASVIMGSGDTLVYVIALYCSSVGVKKTKHLVLVAVLTAIFGIFISSLVSQMLF